MQFPCPQETALLMNVNIAFNRNYEATLYFGQLTYQTSEWMIWNVSFMDNSGKKKREKNPSTCPSIHLA